jgi:hypothetical protein
LVLSIGCAGAASPNQTEEMAIRFAIEVAADVSGPGPVWVQLNEEDAQLGWVKAFWGDERVYFRERCEIEDCVRPGVICGVAPLMVRMIADRGQAGMIEFVWDGMTSVIDPVNGCERREPAPPGEYTAQLCYAREAVLEGDGDPAVAVMGRLVDAQCSVMPFELSDGQDVVFRVSQD